MHNQLFKNESTKPNRPVSKDDLNKTVKNILLSALRRYNSKSKFVQNFTLDASGIRFQTNYNNTEDLYAFYVPITPLNHVIDLVRDIEPIEMIYGSRSVKKRIKVEYSFDGNQEYLILSNYYKRYEPSLSSSPRGIKRATIKITDI